MRFSGKLEEPLPVADVMELERKHFYAVILVASEVVKTKPVYQPSVTGFSGQYPTMCHSFPVVFRICDACLK